MLPAAQGVCSGSESEVRDILGALIAKSLVQVEQGTWGSGKRPLKRFGCTPFSNSGTTPRRCHADWFSVWCDSSTLGDQWASGTLASQIQGDWDNLRTALGVHVADGDMAAATRIVFACISLWRGNHSGKEALD